MGLIKRMRRQVAVYWAKSGTDDYGQPIKVTPVEIKCRWEDIVEEFIDPDDNPQMSKSVVYVDRTVDIGGVLMLGTLTSGVDQANPKENDGAWEIKQFNSLPDLKAKEFLLTAYL